MRRMVQAMAAGVMAAGAVAAAGQGKATYPKGDPLHIWVGNPDAAKARAWAEAHMAAAQAQIDGLLAVKGTRTVENTLRPFDEASRELDLAGSGASLLTNASPNKELRDVGDEVSQKVSAQATALSLNVEVYQALKAIDVSGLGKTDADTATRYYLNRTLLEYRLSGIDKDAATREKVRQLSDQLTSEVAALPTQHRREPGQGDGEGCGRARRPARGLHRAASGWAGRPDHDHDRRAGLSPGDDLCQER